MRIPYRLSGAAAIAVLTISAAGCTDFLTGEGVNSDPNQPNAATTQQLFVATQAAQFDQWTQYNIGSGDHTGDFSQIYLGAGLVDLREIQARTEKSNDRLYAGIAKV